MKINGYMLREALKVWDLRKAAAEAQFKNSLHKFSTEPEKPAPKQVVSDFLKAETAIVLLQVAQTRYNIAVQVEVSGERMPLAQALKSVGVMGRAEKMWKSAAPQERRSYMDDGMTRDPTHEHAQPTVTAKEVLGEVTRVSKLAGALRMALATGNATVVEIEGLEAALFE